MKVKYCFTCDVCGDEAVIEREEGLFVNTNLNLNVIHPTGWVKVNSNIICPKHEITIDTNDGGYIKYNGYGKSEVIKEDK